MSAPTAGRGVRARRCGTAHRRLAPPGTFRRPRPGRGGAPPSVPAELRIPVGLPRGPRVVREVLGEHLESFLEAVEESGSTVPDFVRKELRAMEHCSDFTAGFVRLVCDTCKGPRVVPLCCKGRICPTCAGRRMSEGAAHLVDRVPPPVKVRQWVLTFPGRLAVRLAFDASLAAAVTRIFALALSGWQISRAPFPSPSSPPRRNRHTGSIAFVQRSTDSLSCYFHLHVLAPEGIYLSSDRTLAVEFAPQPAPTPTEVADLLSRYVTRVSRLLRRRGVGELIDDEVPETTQLLLRCANAPGRRRTTSAPTPPRRTPNPLCISHAGFQLHASTTVASTDEAGRERLCRYLKRPALAAGRLTRLPNGDILVRLKRKRRSGVTEWTFEPHAFIARLAALIPTALPHYPILRRFFFCLALSRLRRPRPAGLLTPSASGSRQTGNNAVGRPPSTGLAARHPGLPLRRQASHHRRPHPTRDRGHRPRSDDPLDPGPEASDHPAESLTVPPSKTSCSPRRTATRPSHPLVSTRLGPPDRPARHRTAYAWPQHRRTSTYGTTVQAGARHAQPAPDSRELLQLTASFPLPSPSACDRYSSAPDPW